MDESKTASGEQSRDEESK